MKEPKIPNAETLEDAIQAIVANNVAHGYYPTRFIRIMTGRSGEQLRQRCEQAIVEHWFLGENWSAASNGMLVLEDMVAVHGRMWGFSDDVVRYAQFRADLYRGHIPLL
jgi:hypothetical protein